MLRSDAVVRRTGTTDRGYEIAEDPILDTDHAEQGTVPTPLATVWIETLGTAFAVAPDVSASLARHRSVDQQPRAHQCAVVPCAGPARAGPTKFDYQ